MSASPNQAADLKPSAKSRLSCEPGALASKPRTYEESVPSLCRTAANLTVDRLRLPCAHECVPQATLSERYGPREPQSRPARRRLLRCVGNVGSHTRA